MQRDDEGWPLPWDAEDLVNSPAEILFRSLLA
jgi:hypothetical protein